MLPVAGLDATRNAWTCWMTVHPGRPLLFVKAFYPEPNCTARDPSLGATKSM